MNYIFIIIFVKIKIMIIKNTIEIFKNLIDNKTDEFVSLMKREFEENVKEYSYKECFENEIGESLMYNIFFMKEKFTIFVTFDAIIYNDEKYKSAYLTITPNDFLILSDKFGFDDVDISDIIEDDNALFDDIEIKR